MESLIVAPEEFLAVRHSVLNGNTYDVGQLVEDTLELGQYTGSRKIVPCFEGDIIQVEETGEIVFTHQNFLQLSHVKYSDLKSRKLAASFKEVLDKIANYKQKNKDSRVVLCFEPKSITSAQTIERAVGSLKEYGLRDVYFDSFFGGKLDAVANANLIHGTAYARSLHLIGNRGSVQLMTTRAQEGYEVLTVPHTMSFGAIDEPVIYGAVGSTDILRKIAEYPSVQGAYVRLKEGAGITGALVTLFNSITNTETLRRTHISKYSMV